MTNGFGSYLIVMILDTGFGKSWNDCRYSAIFKLKAISDDFRGVLEKVEGQDEVHDP